MMKVIGCFSNQHDFRLVALAVVICALASFATVNLLFYARGFNGTTQTRWLGIAALAGGSGIWATHFIGMLAFQPELPSHYDVALTVASLVFAILLTAAGLWIAARSRRAAYAWLGGAVLGAGIAVMHFTGMAAFQVTGHIVWDTGIVVVSILLGMVCAGAALALDLKGRSLRRQLLATTMLILAICLHHFVAMGAMTILADPTVVPPDSILPDNWLAGAVAATSFMILFMAGAALWLDMRERRQARLEVERMNSLANAAVEGLLICRDNVVVNANDSFAELIGHERPSLAGRRLSELFKDDVLRLMPTLRPKQPVEGELHHADGTSIPVELMCRTIAFAGQEHAAIAVRDLRARQAAERRIEFLAHHDLLTGLPNRASLYARFEQELELAHAHHGKLAVICLDLDHFKEVNDLFGHAAGDQMLQAVACVVMRLLNKTQTMARLGGDEFLVLSPVPDAAGAETLARAILDALHAENESTGGPPIATSIGIAIYPDDASDRNTLITYADTALYRAKADGRGEFRFFETRMGSEVIERRELEYDLRQAISRDQLRLVFQPQVQIDTKEVFAFEALLRWEHPERGPIAPDLFIPLAEETGIIVAIGEWVLREGCKAAAKWTVPISVAVNVSGVQLHSPRFSDLIREVLVQTGLSPSRLEIEITESALIRDLDRVLLTLRQIKHLGVRIAMDDFGTGYSSLATLRDFPFDRIKVDRSIVASVDKNEQTAAIVRSVLGLGRGLALPVLAEGVETNGELQFLTDELCHAAQGYLVARPGPIEQFNAIHSPEKVTQSVVEAVPDAIPLTSAA